MPGRKFLNKFPALNKSKAAFHWRSFEEFAGVLSKTKLRLNFGSFLGYLNLKESSVGVSDRDLTFREQEKLTSDTKKALASGAFGVSVNLRSDTGGIPRDEIREISAVIARMKRSFSLDFEIGGISKDPRKAEYLKEFLLIFKETESDIILTSLHNPLKNEKEDKEDHELFGEIIAESSSGMNVGIQISPLPWVAVPIAYFLPEIFQENNPQKKINLYRETLFKKEALANISPYLSRIKSVAGTPKNIASFAGRTLEELSDLLHLSREDALLFLAESSRLKATVFCEECAYCKNKFSRFSLTILSSGNAYSSGSSVFGRERAVPSFLKNVYEVFGGSFEQMVPRITSLPARKYQIAERGVIAEGMFADIIIADQNLEITHTLVNGSLSFEKSENGKIKKVVPAPFAGKFLKK